MTDKRGWGGTFKVEIFKTIETRREPAGDGYQACIDGDWRRWARGDTEAQAVGNLIRDHGQYVAHPVPCEHRFQGRCEACQPATAAPTG